MTMPAPTRGRTRAVLAGTLAALIVLAGCSSTAGAAGGGNEDTPVAEASAADTEDVGAADAGDEDASDAGDGAGTDAEDDSAADAEDVGTGDAEEEGGAADPAGEAGADSLLPAAEGTTDYPLTLQTWAGETVVEQRPERIAVIGFSTNVDFLQAIDVIPVYTMTEDAEYAWRDDAWFAEIEVVDAATRRDPTNFEAIAAADPDLIIALNFLADEGEFDRLTDIAPVLEYEEQLGDQADWRRGQRLVGEVLDLAAVADEAVDGADRAIADVAAAHPELQGSTITMGVDYGAEFGFEYYTPAGGTAEGIMSDLGFEPNPLAESFVDDPIISDENLALLDGDVLLVIYPDQARREEREAMPLFQALPPVSEDRYIALTTSEEDPMRLVAADGTESDNATWVLRRGASAVSLPWAVEVIADQWLAGVDL